MPWVEVAFRGQKVLARTKDDGALDVQQGRVEIRYRPTDARAYRASLGNITRIEGAALQPDDTCVSGAFVPLRTPSAPSIKAAAAVVPTATGDGRTWIAYTDGACSGNPGPAGAGIVLITPDGKTTESSEWLGEATNNIAELTAILRALEAIPKNATDAVIHTDSQYAIGVLTKGWRPKANQQLIADIKRELAEHKGVRFVYVPGHAGVPMNERADSLAREAIRTGSTRRLAPH
ncbi:ribonuclease HI [Pendulispora albinea]|uniref:Ribonuclease HI n=1 Tax=Pendulispora albinea TaxID=2741071 RepID=A0ABZ2LTX6_9BACT